MPRPKRRASISESLKRLDRESAELGKAFDRIRDELEWINERKAALVLQFETHVLRFKDWSRRVELVGVDIRALKPADSPADVVGAFVAELAKAATPESIAAGADLLRERQGLLAGTES